MKKQLFFINNESGFILPHVLLIATILLITVMTNINIYQKNVHLTYYHIDQLRIETLFQMGYAKFQNEFSPVDLDHQKTVTYHFPDGRVTIEFNQLNDEEGQLHFHLMTNNDTNLTIIKPINLSLK